MTKNSRVFEKDCIYCGNHFIAAKPFGKFCADKCRVYYSIDKKAYEQNINEQLPALLSRVKEEVDKLSGTNDKEKYELEQAISLILQAQSKLNASSIKLKSFDEHLIQKNKAKGISTPVKELKTIPTPKVKPKKIIEVPEEETVPENFQIDEFILDKLPKIQEKAKPKNIQIEEIVLDRLPEVQELTKTETIITDLNIIEEIETENFADVETKQILQEQTEEHQRSSESPINAVANSSPDTTGETPNGDELDVAKAWLQRYLKKGFDKID